MKYTASSPGKVALLPGDLYERYVLNCAYMMDLKSDALMLNFYSEAGLIADTLPSHTLPEGIHTGWESPTCQLRGHFLGHYLSACAFGYAYMGNTELKGRGDHLVKELKRCQEESEDGWVFSIPREYMSWIARGKKVWAPQYTIHKTLMGLMDMYRFAGNQLALQVASRAADWFVHYAAQYSLEEFDNILDVETGGMMEFFADLYEATGDARHKELMEKYYRRRLFDPLMAGKDVLSNMHANTTIPETLGCARAYEVTHEERYLEVCKAYWELAVTKRGYFVTGGQTCYEAWTPPFTFGDRLNEDNQEHCTVYNMIRLADFLFRHTGDANYLDYIELNYYNGILAQQHQNTGMVGYYLPMQPGGKVNWGTPTANFWCCHGTLVQAQMLHTAGVFYQGGDNSILIAQYRQASGQFSIGGEKLSIAIKEDYNYPYQLARPYPQAIEDSYKPFRGRRYRIAVTGEDKAEHRLSLHIPDWVKGKAEIRVDGEKPLKGSAGEIIHLQRCWRKSDILVIFDSEVRAFPLPDQPTRVAFRDGPDVLVGLTVSDQIQMDAQSPDASKAVRLDSRKGHVHQQVYYRLLAQAGHPTMIRLSELRDETYTMYFTMETTGGATDRKSIKEEAP